LQQQRAQFRGGSSAASLTPPRRSASPRPPEIQPLAGCPALPRAPEQLAGVPRGHSQPAGGSVSLPARWAAHRERVLQRSTLTVQANAAWACGCARRVPQSICLLTGRPSVHAGPVAAAEARHAAVRLHPQAARAGEGCVFFPFCCCLEPERGPGGDAWPHRAAPPTLARFARCAAWRCCSDAEPAQQPQRFDSPASYPCSAACAGGHHGLQGGGAERAAPVGPLWAHPGHRLLG
jgi:hypothetical protein